MEKDTAGASWVFDPHPHHHLPLGMNVGFCCTWKHSYTPELSSSLVTQFSFFRAILGGLLVSEGKQRSSGSMEEGR